MIHVEVKRERATIGKRRSILVATGDCGKVSRRWVKDALRIDDDQREIATQHLWTYRCACSRLTERPYSGDN